jgi:hypothetical protein
MDLTSRLRSLERATRTQEVCGACSGRGGLAVVLVRGDAQVAESDCPQCGRRGHPRKVIRLFGSCAERVAQDRSR